MLYYRIGLDGPPSPALVLRSGAMLCLADGGLDRLGPLDLAACQSDELVRVTLNDGKDCWVLAASIDCIIQ